ncbi:MAG: hypothetical protein GYA14_10485 [Ignavibacteria bacterium]|nr:hypothetical protein [Ignavibacteria bacterium]
MANVGINSEFSSRNILSIGPEIGFTLNNQEKIVIPYLFTGLQWDHFYTSYEDVVGNDKVSDNGYSFPINCGVIFTIYDVIGIQFEGGFIYRKVNENTLKTLSFSIGFCGIGKRSAISVLNTLSTLYY